MTLPAKWARYPYSGCTRVDEGWGECSALSAADTSSGNAVLPLLTYATPRSRTEFWIVPAGGSVAGRLGRVMITAATAAATLATAACSGCDQPESAPSSGGEQQVVVEVVDGAPSAVDVNGGFYALPRAAWSSYADGAAATVAVDTAGAVTLRRPGVQPVTLEGPLRCE